MWEEPNATPVLQSEGVHQTLDPRKVADIRTLIPREKIRHNQYVNTDVAKEHGTTVIFVYPVSMDEGMRLLFLLLFHPMNTGNIIDILENKM